ncbi:helix-turn-helix domain-containing protein [Streptomyces sp. NBC_00654]|uniref:helix-turn-helix domain-containing protein n=1 Tax=Streptomyces sp. NBC_00654 TaxID=2975799 RepID=UPI00225BFFA5|nr:helix-turn-helix domain-containing protein [Streptomyces sp. NBC_00654]MCX4970833.1 helix-turn-helix domain-containing protein [Streptomyces sp. NBC_00654]
MPIRSHSSPDRPARSGPAVDADRAARCTESLRDIAEDITVLGEAFVYNTCDRAAPTTELLETVTALQDLVQEAIAAIVVRQRSQGEPLSDLAPMLKRTEDRLRKKYDPQAVDQNLATRTRPMRSPSSTLPPGDVPTAKNLLRQPRQRLASALTLVRAQSGISQRALADRMNVDPSYVSRLLSGERDVSWPHAKIIIDTCDGNSDLIKPLWEAAIGVQPASAEPTRYLRTYLQGLRYAAGSPDDKQILKSTHHTITTAELHQAFDGPGVPVWPVISQLTMALQSLPDIARPLWRRARSSTETCTLPAEAFG